MQHLTRVPRLRPTKQWASLWGIMLTLVLLLAACGGGSTSAPSSPSSTTPAQASVAGTFVGTVNQTGSSAKAAFGLVSNGQKFIAYLCDGGVNGTVSNPKPLTVAQWFMGNVVNNAIKGTDTQGSQLVASLTAQGVTGTLTLNDGRIFSLKVPVISGSMRNSLNDAVGLYRDEETFNGVRYLAGAATDTNVPPVAFSLSGSVVDLPLFRPLTPYTRPWIHGGSVINEQTGTVVVLAEPDGGVHDGVQLQLSGVGTFTLHRAQP